MSEFFNKFPQGPVGYKTYPKQQYIGEAVDVYMSDDWVSGPLRGVVLRCDNGFHASSTIVRLDDGRFVLDGEARDIKLRHAIPSGQQQPEIDSIARLSADAMPARTRDLDLTERIAALEKRLESHTSNHGAADGFTTQVNQRLANIDSWREGTDKWVGEIEEYTKETREVTTANVNKLHGQCENTISRTQKKINDVHQKIHDVDEQCGKELRRLRGDGGTAFKLIKALDERLAKLEALPVATRSKTGHRVDHTMKELAESNIDADDVSTLVTDPDVARELASGRYFTPKADVRLKILLQRNHFHAFAEVAIGCVLCEHCGIELEDYQRSMLTSDMRTVCPQAPLSQDNALANLQMWAVRHGHGFGCTSGLNMDVCCNCRLGRATYEVTSATTLNMCPKQPQGDERFVQEKKSP